MTVPEQLAMQGFWADRPDEDFNHPDGQICDTRTTTPSISEAPGSLS